jgi:hypothetical protein
MQDTIVREALQAGGGKGVEQGKLNTLITHTEYTKTPPQTCFNRQGSFHSSIA